MADGRIKAIWIMATNPAASMPRASRVRAALAAFPALGPRRLPLYLYAADGRVGDVTKLRARMFSPLSGTLEDAAVLFFDIRGFSTASEKMGPVPLLKALNDHLAIINARVAKHRGTIVNFIGDAVLAIFGCPVLLPDAAAAAVRCYLEAREELAAFQQHREATGEHCFDLGAGINHGSLVSGAIGSKERLSYSVLGDEVNLAARLESLTRHYPTEMIFSETCFDQLPDELKAHALLIDRCTVKGRKQPTGLYTLTSAPPEEKTAYEAALQKYLSGDFLAAESAFNEIPGPLAAYMRRRCGQLQVEEGKFWPGYYSWEVK